MNYRILFFTIGLAIFLMGSVLFFVVSAGAKQAQNHVLSEQQGNDLSSPTITKGIFEAGDPAFQTLEHACVVPFLDQVYVNVVMRYREVPQSCEFFVNGEYITGERNLQPDCIGECPSGEFSRTFALGYHDVRESHIVRVCCNSICIEKPLRALCEDNRDSENDSGSSMKSFFK